jgi:hypothetical protein
LNQVILEREFDPRLTPDGFRCMALESVDCLSIYRIEWQESMLATDGARLLCRFQAPDAESVRQVAQDPAVRARVAWTGTVHDTGRDGSANVVVARDFDEPTTVEAMQAIEDAAAWCLEQRQVTFLRTFFSTNCRRMLCLYQAPDAESVRQAQREAGMPVERVWACQAFDPDSFAAT